MSYDNPKITGSDTIQTTLLKMSKGNPGAVSVLIRILKEGDAIDPDNILGSMGVVLHLDALSIYSSDIWLLYKDVCQEDLPTMLGLLRAVQLGYCTGRELGNAIKDPRRFPAECKEDLIKQVKERLPAFGKGS